MANWFCGDFCEFSSPVVVANSRLPCPLKLRLTTQVTPLESTDAEALEMSLPDTATLSRTYFVVPSFEQVTRYSFGLSGTPPCRLAAFEQSRASYSFSSCVWSVLWIGGTGDVDDAVGLGDALASAVGVAAGAVFALSFFPVAVAVDVGLGVALLVAIPPPRR